ncbi:10764_t:CDS:2 [Rhizophagus irregularis]|nr:10764_t:CDS:2 [Rhizophagus irregularis]
MRAKLSANISLTKGMYADKLVPEKKDAKFIGKGDSETLANNVGNKLPQSMQINFIRTLEWFLEWSGLGGLVYFLAIKWPGRIAPPTSDMKLAYIYQQNSWVARWCTSSNQMGWPW